MLKYILLWFPMLLIAILNGALREWYKIYTGEMLAKQISTISLILFFGIYIYWAVKKFPIKSDFQALQIGCLWLVMTLIFEFGFGLYRGNSWNQLLAEYNIFEGKLWVLVPIWVLLAPYLLRKL